MTPPPEKVHKQTVSPEVALRDAYNNPAALFYPTTNYESRFVHEILWPSEQATKSRGALLTLEIKASGAEFNRSKSSFHATEAGRAAVASRLHGYGDFLENAAESLRSIQIVKSLLDTSGSKDLPEAILGRGVISEGQNIIDLVAPIARFAALSRFAEKSERPKGFDPLQTFKNRSTPVLWRPSAQKRISDAFTGSRRSIAATEYISDFVSTTSVAEMRKLLPHAIIDQQNRGRFWLQELTQVHATYRPMAQAILKLCMQSKG